MPRTLRFIVFIAILALPALLFNTLELNKPFPKAIFVSTILLWVTEIIPLAVTGLMVPVMMALFGVCDAKDAFQSFGNEILFLFVGCFLMAQSMQKHALDKRLAYSLLSTRLGNSSPAIVVAVVALISWFLSMWMSNSATTAMMVPVCIGISEVFKSEFSDPKDAKNFAIRLLIGCAFASSIGGLATPIGSPPNVIGIELLKEQGTTIGFLKWIKLALPVSLLLLVALVFLLGYIFPVERIQSKNLSTHFKSLLKDMGRISTGEKQIMFVFLTAISMWVVPDILLNINPDSGLFKQISSRVSMTTGALFPALFLFILPINSERTAYNLSWEDAAKIDWGTIMLFGGGISLGAMLSSTGLATELSISLFSNYKDSLIVSGIIIIFVSLMLSEFASNTAAASILIPLVLSGPASSGDTSLHLTMACIFASSLGFMLPVSTPPNAIIYASGSVPAKSLMKAGVIFDILGMVLTFLIILLLWPSLGLY